MSSLGIIRTCPGSILGLLCMIMEAIESEVKKLIDSGFVREEQHPDWVANIIVVLKKNGKIHIYINYRDLNAACLKDEFLLLIMDV